MVAMVAPRGLFIMENPHIAHLAPRSGSVAALGGAEVYKALGAGSNISYWSDVQSGTHCSVRPEWKAPLQQSLQAFLLKTGNPPGVFRISSVKAGGLATWRDWTTPTLTGGGPTSPQPTSPQPTSPQPTSPQPTSPQPTSASPTSTPPVGGCSASVSINQWSGGFTAAARVTAGSSRITGWTVTTTLPSGAAVTSTWNTGSSGSTGTVRFTSVSYNGALAAGQSTDFGFQGTGSATGMTTTCSAR
jgi:hypothetical protein